MIRNPRRRETVLDGSRTCTGTASSPPHGRVGQYPTDGPFSSATTMVPGFCSTAADYPCSLASFPLDRVRHSTTLARVHAQQSLLRTLWLIHAHLHATRGQRLSVAPLAATVRGSQDVVHQADVGATRLAESGSLEPRAARKLRRCRADPTLFWLRIRWPLFAGPWILAGPGIPTPTTRPPCMRIAAVCCRALSCVHEGGMMRVSRGTCPLRDGERPCLACSTASW